jgi:integrase
MGRKTISGLYERRGVWHIDKHVRGYGRLCESTGESTREGAESYLIRRLAEIRAGLIAQREEAERPKVFREAAARFLEEYADQPSAWLSATYLEQLDPFIGHWPLTHIDDDALKPFIAFKRQPVVKDGKVVRGPVSNRTINIALQRVVRVLHLCNRTWRDEQKRPWLAAVPAITMLEEGKTSRQAYPLSWEEQTYLFRELPEHLQRMALFKVNTGCREQEVCKLRWEWEVEVPELNTSVFLIPADFGGRTEKSGVKNGDDRLVVLNNIAASVIHGQRGKHDELVFPYGDADEARALHRMNDTAWRSARERAAKKWEEDKGQKADRGFASVRIHDLKHTFGRRLRAANVAFEDRQVLLGHKSGSVTTHYSGAELAALIEAAKKVAGTDSRSPTLTILKRRIA